MERGDAWGTLCFGRTPSPSNPTFESHPRRAASTKTRSIRAVQSAIVTPFRAADSLSLEGLAGPPTLSAKMSNVFNNLDVFHPLNGTSLPVHRGGPKCGPSFISDSTPKPVSCTTAASCPPSFARSSARPRSPGRWGQRRSTMPRSSDGWRSTGTPNSGSLTPAKSSPGSLTGMSGTIVAPRPS